MVELWRAAHPWARRAEPGAAPRALVPRALLQGLPCALPGPRYSAQKSWQEGP